MEQKINIAELLKDCPKGMELDCTICNGVKFIELDKNPNYPIVVRANNGYEFSLTKYGQVHNIEDAKCVIYPKGKTTWEGFVPPCEFKDGDVLVHTQNERFIMSIYKSNEIGIIINTHVIFWDREEGLSVGMQICCYTDSTRFATEEEKAKLFQAIKDNGYKWNHENKTLEKLSLTQSKFDITTLVPFESRVLVRDSIDGIEEYDGECSAVWRPAVFGIYAKDIGDAYPFGVVGGCYFRYCIPYDKNEHLLGTTDDCDEFYKTWEK